MQPNSTCTLSQTAPLDMATGPSCVSEFFRDTAIISSCNVTGQWVTPDEELRILCDSTVGLIHRISYGGFTFSNIFCLMCNFPPIHKYVEYCTQSFIARNPVYIGHDYSSPFSLLLGASGDNEHILQTNISLLQDVQVKCTSGKLFENDTCFTPIDKIRGLAYRLNVFYTPLFQGVPETTVHAFLNLTGDKYMNLLSIFTITLAIKFDELKQGVILDGSVGSKAGVIYLPGPYSQTDMLEMSRLLLYYDATFVSVLEPSRDEVESTLVSTFFSEHLTYKSSTFNITFQPMLPSGDDVLDSQCFENLWDPHHLSCREYPFKNTANFDYGVADSEYITLTPMLTCPFVEFNASDYDYPLDSSNLTRVGNLTLQLLGHTVELGGNWTDMNLIVEDNRKGILRVCNSLLEEKVKNILVRTAAKVSNFAQFRYYFTLVCISLSMLCLILTLVTYLSFRLLRSPAGINNMLLCFSLLAANAFLLASVHMRPKDPLCTIVGITTHFMWLNMFCWTFVCCFHMFRTFTATSRSTASTDRAKILCIVRKVSFCTIVPLIVVITVIVASYLTAEDDSIGYGSFSCYLDSQLLVVASMIFPLSLLIISNIVFFAITVCKIRSVRKLQGNLDVTPGAPKDIYVYVKLSSLTGCFWTLAVAAKYLDSDALGVTSDFFIGLQGAFIFWSYVCNERVSNLYRKAFGMTVVITSRTGTITRIARDVEKVEARKKWTSF